MAFWGLIVDPEKVQKCHFFTFKMAGIYQGQGNLRSYSRTRCLLPQVMFLPRFFWITRIDLEKSAKMWYFLLKMAAILWNLWQLGRNFGLHSGTTQDLCLQNMIGISRVILRSRTKIPVHILDPAAASMLSKIVVALTLNVEPNYNESTSDLSLTITG